MTLGTLQHAFEVCGLHYEILELNAEWSLLISQHGGHIFGPFSEHCPQGVFWTPPKLDDPAYLAQLVQEKTWNIGGERLWIAPEIAFNITERARYQETLDTPKSIDPGCYSLLQDTRGVHLQQSFSLQAYNIAKGSLVLELKRCVQAAQNPLRELNHYTNLMQGVSYCGFNHMLDLTVTEGDDLCAECWCLTQIRPFGKLYIPMYQAENGTDHYEPCGKNEHLKARGVELDITGQSKYKIAYKTARITGRMGYLSILENGSNILIIKNFPNDPACLYTEEPPMIEGDKGYTIHVYNDDGKLGGFAEMECNMPPVGKPMGNMRGIDRLSTWIFTGPKENLDRITLQLLGETIVL